MRTTNKFETNEEIDFWDFPGSPVVRTRCFHCRGLFSIPGGRTKILCGVAKKKKKKEFQHRNRVSAYK